MPFPARRWLWPAALTVEAVHLRDLPGLVVAAQQCDLVGPLGLERQQPGERLQAVVAAVHEIAQEHVVGVGNLAAPGHCQPAQPLGNLSRVCGN